VGIEKISLGEPNVLPLCSRRESVALGEFFMARVPSKAWTKASVSPLDIALDRDNPRINIEAADKESDIIRKLIMHEEVQDLARKIAANGLLPGERIIITQEKGLWVVLEGNRRICACKLLLSPALIPQQFQKTFPTLTTATELLRIQKVDADVAPDRRSAEPVLTLRHSESGIRKWKPVARMRRVRRLLDEGFTVDQIALEYNATAGNIRKTIKEYRLLQLAENLKGLNAAEKQNLSDPDLRTNPYRLFRPIERERISWA
jgi:ParB-like nuclease domain